jgi:Raf kinase inhibitor-like YbhB/YbcL family protein
MTLRIGSPAFLHEGDIPARHTCEGKDLSPPLEWGGAPAGARSLVLIVDDPDAPDPARPQRVWVHWLLYNLPAGSGGLPQGAGNGPTPAGARDAVTDANTHGWHGPCPPIGRHRYFFHLIALDAELPDLGAGARRGDLERAMEGHVLETAVLMGTYAKAGRPAR